MVGKNYLTNFDTELFSLWLIKWCLLKKSRSNSFIFTELLPFVWYTIEVVVKIIWKCMKLRWVQHFTDEGLYYGIFIKIRLLGICRMLIIMLMEAATSSQPQILNLLGTIQDWTVRQKVRQKQQTWFVYYTRISKNIYGCTKLVSCP